MPVQWNDDNFYSFIKEGDGGFCSRKVLIEGDSWVSHPQLANLTLQFDMEGRGDWAILSIGSPGDEAMEILPYGSAQNRKLLQLIETERYGYKWDLIVLSAGGNDIIGKEIQDLVHDKKEHPELYGADLINEIFDERVTKIVDGYREFLQACRDSQCLNRKTPIITHVYSEIHPRRVGTHLGSVTFNDGWIAKHFENERGITDKKEQGLIVRAMLERFQKAIKALESKKNKLLVVDTLDVLNKNGKPNLEWWHDEIHPNALGFKRVFKAMRKEAKAQGIWL